MRGSQGTARSKQDGHKRERRAAPRHAYDHEREGARTSGVTDLIVVGSTTAPFGCNIAVHTNVGSGKRFRKWRADNLRSGRSTVAGTAAAALLRRRHRARALLLDPVDQERDRAAREHDPERDD